MLKSLTSRSKQVWIAVQERGRQWVMLYALLSVFLSCMQFVRSVTAPIERLSSFIAIMRMFVLIDATLWYSKDELFVMWQGCSTNIMNRICFISLSPMPSLR